MLMYILKLHCFSKTLPLLTRRVKEDSIAKMLNVYLIISKKRLRSSGRQCILTDIFESTILFETDCVIDNPKLLTFVNNDFNDEKCQKLCFKVQNGKLDKWEIGELLLIKDQLCNLILEIVNDKIGEVGFSSRIEMS